MTQATKIMAQIQTRIYPDYDTLWGKEKLELEVEEVPESVALSCQISCCHQDLGSRCVH